MEKSFTLMKIAAVAITVAVVVAAAIMITDGGKARFNKATSQMNSAASEFDNPALQAYDGATITGAEVITAINKYASSTMPIRVKTTGESNKLYIRSYSEETNLKLIGKTAADLQSEKINESAIFTGRLIRDKNNEIRELIFEQSTIDKTGLVYSLDGAIMSGVEVKETIDKYKGSWHMVWLWHDRGPFDSLTEYAGSYIDSSEFYRCFTMIAYDELGFNFVNISDPPLLYDGLILTGEEVRNLLKGSCKGYWSYAYTNSYPVGFSYNAGGASEEIKLASINSSSRFKTECGRVHAYNDGDGKPITGLNFYQIIE